MTRHTIGIVSKLTGLKPDVIRAWERRYQAIEPLRTETNRRYYTDEQVERLKLMHRATLSGRQIGQIANLSTEELRQLVQSDQQALSQVPGAKKDALKPELEERLEDCISAIKDLDAVRFKQLLDNSLVEFTQVRVLEALIGPLLERIGIFWETGEFRIAEEHLATAVIRSFLFEVLQSYSPTGDAPVVICGTPANQVHELGALITGVVAASEGWKVIYLGPSLPADELASAAQRVSARSICLSIVHPAGDPILTKEILRLRHLVGDRVEIIIGGRAAPAYTKTAEKISAKIVSEIRDLRSVLRL